MSKSEEKELTEEEILQDIRDIINAWRTYKASPFVLGEFLMRMQKELGRGNWKKLFKEHKGSKVNSEDKIPFSYGKARMLIKIAGAKRFREMKQDPSDGVMSA